MWIDRGHVNRWVSAECTALLPHTLRPSKYDVLRHQVGRIFVRFRVQSREMRSGVRMVFHSEKGGGGLLPARRKREAGGGRREAENDQKSRRRPSPPTPPVFWNTCETRARWRARAAWPDPPTRSWPPLPGSSLSVTVFAISERVRGGVVWGALRPGWGRAGSGERRPAGEGLHDEDHDGREEGRTCARDQGGVSPADGPAKNKTPSADREPASLHRPHPGPSEGLSHGADGRPGSGSRRLQSGAVPPRPLAPTPTTARFGLGVASLHPDRSRRRSRVEPSHDDGPGAPDRTGRESIRELLRVRGVTVGPRGCPRRGGRGAGHPGMAALPWIRARGPARLAGVSGSERGTGPAWVDGREGEREEWRAAREVGLAQVGLWLTCGESQLRRTDAGRAPAIAPKRPPMVLVRWASSTRRGVEEAERRQRARVSRGERLARPPPAQISRRSRGEGCATPNQTPRIMSRPPIFVSESAADPPSALHTATEAGRGRDVPRHSHSHSHSHSNTHSNTHSHKREPEQESKQEPPRAAPGISRLPPPPPSLGRGSATWTSTLPSCPVVVVDARRTRLSVRTPRSRTRRDATGREGSRRDAPLHRLVLVGFHAPSRSRISTSPDTSDTSDTPAQRGTARHSTYPAEEPPRHPQAGGRKVSRGGAGGAGGALGLRSPLPAPRSQRPPVPPFQRVGSGLAACALALAGKKGGGRGLPPGWLVSRARGAGGGGRGREGKGREGERERGSGEGETQHKSTRPRPEERETPCREGSRGSSPAVGRAEQSRAEQSTSRQAWVDLAPRCSPPHSFTPTPPPPRRALDPKGASTAAARVGRLLSLSLSLSPVSGLLSFSPLRPLPSARGPRSQGTRTLH
ncbi:hypothetical protein JHW43_006265 [Diplocarpon mali]|nr:hypothetical protein JHW43_006265 [Diplocarpon mali]